MSTLNNARMPTLRDKHAEMEETALKEREKEEKRDEKGMKHRGRITKSKSKK